MDNSVVVNKCGLCGQEYRCEQACFVGSHGHSLGYVGTGIANCIDGSVTFIAISANNPLHDICPECAIKQILAIVTGKHKHIPEIMSNPLPPAGRRDNG